MSRYCQKISHSLLTTPDYRDSLYVTSDYCDSPARERQALPGNRQRLPGQYSRQRYRRGNRQHTQRRIYRKGDAMDVKLFDSELKVMEVLWEQGPKNAKDIVEILAKSIGWNKNTTYTVIKKCIEKGAVERSEPGFLCTPLVTKEEVARSETEQLIDKMYGGSSELFFSAFLKNQGISQEDALRLARMIEEAK